jgi:solute:Na+ symporter, SSS family
MLGHDGPVSRVAILAQENGEAAQQFDLGTIDLTIVVIYIVGILAFGFWVGRRQGSDTESYFLAGRGAIWPLIGFSLMAANMSGSSYVGIAGAGYSEGISVWNFEWGATIVLVFFALFVLPFYIRSKISTAPEFLERRYDGRSKKAFSAFTVFTAMFIDSAGAMFAGAIVLQLLFPGVPLWIHVSTIALLGGVYVLAGGIHAVHLTDLVQGILLIGAGLAMTVIIFGTELNWQWSALYETSPEGGMTITPPADDDFMPWPGIFTGVIWLSVYYWMTNHVVVQKTLTATNVDHGRWGVLFNGFMQLIMLFVLVMPGLMGRAIVGELDDPDQVWPALAFEVMPIGIRGLVLAALVAALMSTLDSVLIGASSLVTQDFVKPSDRFDLSERQLLILGRVLVGFFMVLAAVWAPQIADFPGLVEYFQSFLGAITMPVIVLFLGGIFWKRATKQGAFWTLVIGAPIGLAFFITNEVLDLLGIQFLYMTGIMLVLSLVLFVAISLSTPAHAFAEVEQFMFTRDVWRQETEELREKPWWQNYRYMAIALLVLTTAAIIPFIGPAQ